MVTAFLVLMVAATALVAINSRPVGAAIPPALAPAPGPAVARDAPDPDIVRVGSTFYAFTTGTTWGNRIGVLKSGQPGSGWNTRTGGNFGSTGLAGLPGWVAESIAPGVFEWGGRFVMYYSARPAAGGHWCLSVATSSSPDAAFNDSSTGCWYADDANGGAVDPDPWVDTDGRAWLTWKTTDGTSGLAAKLWSAPLSADGLSFTEAPRQILHQDEVPYNGYKTIENPQMINAGGQYYLFFSHGVWESADYRVGYAACSSPVGPCVSAPAPILESYENVQGPGGQSLVMDTSGQWWMAYHGWTGSCASYSCGGQRQYYVTKVSFDLRVPCSAPAQPQGYRFAASDGGVFNFGNLPFCGSTGAVTLVRPVVGMAGTNSGGGYWLFSGDGGVFTFGDANFFGSTGGFPINQPIVTMAPTPSNQGYWMIATDGGVFSFGDAVFHGSTGAMALNQPIVGMAATPSGNGYWLVARDGGIFSFGDAVFQGSTGAMALNQPIVGMAATPSGNGYWLVARDGGIFSFGDAVFQGSTGAMALNQPIVGMAPTDSGNGYWFVASDGGIFSFGDAAFFGSTGALALNRPIVGMAA